MKTQYEIIPDSKDQLAKRSTYTNLINGKIITFPNVSFYLKNPAQVKLFSKYLKESGFSHNIKGVCVPIDRAELLSNIDETIKNSSLLIVDPLAEVFYYGTLKPEIYSRYSAIPGLPAEIVSFLSQPNKEQNWAKKDDEYAEFIDTKLLNPRVKTQIATAISNHQLRFDTDILHPFAPVIRNDTMSLHACREFYELTRRLYLGGTTDIDENSGKRIALYLPIHKSVLSNDSKMDEIISFISNQQHDAITLKVLITDNSTIRDFSFQEAFNLLRLMKTIGTYSIVNKIPCHMLCSNSLGLIAISHGFDSFSQPLGRKEVEKESGFAEKARQALLAKNPTFDFGQIYHFDTRSYITHDTYTKMIKYQNLNQLPCPGPYCSSKNPSDVLSMKRNVFWEHAKLHLFEMRNYEIDELLEAMQNKEIRGFRSRFKNFFNGFLLPE